MLQAMRAACWHLLAPDEEEEDRAQEGLGEGCVPSADKMQTGGDETARVLGPERLGDEEIWTQSVGNWTAARRGRCLLLRHRGCCPHA